MIPSEAIVAGFRTALETNEDQGLAEAIVKGGGRIVKPFLGIDMTLSAVLNVLNNYEPQTGRAVYGQGVKFEDVIANPIDNSHEFASMMAYLGRTLGAGFVTNIVDFYRANASAPSEDQSILESIMGSGNQMSSSGREFTNADATAAVLGFRSRTFSIDQMMTNTSRGMRKELDAINSRLRDRTDRFASISPDDLDGMVAGTLTSRKKTYDKAIAMIQYMSKKGYTKKEIETTLYDKEGGSLYKSEVETLMKGAYPEYEPKETLIKSTVRAMKYTNDTDPNWYKNSKAMADRLKYVNQQFIEQQSTLEFR